MKKKKEKECKSHEYRWSIRIKKRERREEKLI